MMVSTRVFLALLLPLIVQGAPPPPPPPPSPPNHEPVTRPPLNWNEQNLDLRLPPIRHQQPNQPNPPTWHQQPNQPNPPQLTWHQWQLNQPNPPTWHQPNPPQLTWHQWQPNQPNPPTWHQPNPPQLTWHQWQPNQPNPPQHQLPNQSDPQRRDLIPTDLGLRALELEATSRYGIRGGPINKAIPGNNYYCIPPVVVVEDSHRVSSVVVVQRPHGHGIQHLPPGQVIRLENANIPLSRITDINRSLDHGQVKIPVLDIGAILLPPGSVYELGTEKIAIPENQYVELPSTAVVTIPLVGYCRQTQGQIVRIMDTKELEHIEEICKNWYHREVIIPSQIPNLIDSYIKHCKKIVFGRLAERSPNPYWRLPPP